MVSCINTKTNTHSKENTTTTEQKQPKKLKDKFSNLAKETFYVKDDCILFLKPSNEYFKEHLKDNEGIAEVSSDFDFYTNKYFKKRDGEYKIYFVTQRMIALINSKNDTTIIDRYHKDLIYGTIIQQKDSVQILNGVQTDIDLDMALGIFNPNKK